MLKEIIGMQGVACGEQTWPTQILLTAMNVVNRQLSGWSLPNCKDPLFPRSFSSRGGLHPMIDQGKGRKSRSFEPKGSNSLGPFNVYSSPRACVVLLGAWQPYSLFSICFFPFSSMAVDLKGTS